MTLTLEQLSRIYTMASPTRLGAWLLYLNTAMAEADINTALRMAAFLAQVGHESGELRYTEELASGAAYEGRKDLGNFRQGDGVRFKGRGLIQLTGRRNYELAGKALGLDLEQEPELAAQRDVAARIAAWFWRTKNLNQLADQGDFETITRRINGGLNGESQRLAYYQRALAALERSEAVA